MAENVEFFSTSGTDRRYKLTKIKLIDAGNSCEVYVVKSTPIQLKFIPEIKEHYVLKCLKLNDIKPAIQVRDVKHYVKLLELNHENIIKYIDYAKQLIVGESDWFFLYSLMEYVTGGTLSDYCREKKLAEEDVAKLTGQIVDGLAYLHSFNDPKMIHGDIKPDNIVLSSDRKTVKICDLDGALFLQASTTISSDLAKGITGTIFYMSPEMLRYYKGVDKEKKEIGRRTDIWSLGCVVLFMMGKFTFTTASDGTHRVEDKQYDYENIVINDGFPDIPENYAMTDFLRRCFIHNLKNENEPMRCTAEDLMKYPFAHRPITFIMRLDDEIYLWNPIKTDLLATGGKKAKIWNLQKNVQLNVIIHELNHLGYADDSFICSLDWSRDGEFLCTAFANGLFSIWSVDGHLCQNLKGKQINPTFVKWNKSGNRIASQGNNMIIDIWNVTTGEIEKQFRRRSTYEYVFNIDWKDDETLASKGVSNIIKVFNLKNDNPIQEFQEHTHNIHDIKWDPQGVFLASCSYDKTIKIWKMESSKAVKTLTGHERWIMFIEWSNSGPGTNHPNSAKQLGSFSVDKTIRIWDVEKGNCIVIINTEMDDDLSYWSVYSSLPFRIFSPDTKLIVVGLPEKGMIRIFSSESGELVKEYIHHLPVYEVGWNSNGEMLAAKCKDNSVIVLKV